MRPHLKGDTVNIEEAFDQLQEEVNVPPGADDKARERRQLFSDALEDVAEVTEVVVSGSLARGSQIDPINDVDIIVVFDPTEHSEWGGAGDSAEEALVHTQSLVRDLLGRADGSFAKEVRRIEVRNHSVKCWLDDPDDDDAFTVDVMPALRCGDVEPLRFRVPEKLSKKWIETDPEFLIREVRARHSEDFRFVSLVRVLKRWNKDAKAGMKSLVVELLALQYLEPSTRPMSLQRFFTAAEDHFKRRDPVLDPAGLCGEIDPDMDYDLAYEKLKSAASESWKAVTAQASGTTDVAACRWANVFGDIFPTPEEGCSMLDEGSSGTGLLVTVGSGGVVMDEPRPVVDSPQG